MGRGATTTISCTTLALCLALIAGPALAQAVPAPSKPPTAKSISCSGPFARDSSFAKLQQAFGAANVSMEEITETEGEKAIVTVLYGKDKARRIAIGWRDPKKREGIDSITFGDRAQWVVAGLHIGSTLNEVEKLNGKQFALAGFDWDYGGTVLDWQGGKFAAMPGGCHLGVRFAADRDSPAAARDQVMGDNEFASTDPNMRASKPRIYEIYLGYPDAEPAESK